MKLDHSSSITHSKVMLHNQASFNSPYSNLHITNQPFQLVNSSQQLKNDQAPSFILANPQQSSASLISFINVESDAKKIFSNPYKCVESINPHETGDDADEEDSSDDSDDETEKKGLRKSDHVFVTIDVSTEAADLLKKLAIENFYRLREIGVLAMQLNDESFIKIIKKNQQLENLKTPSTPVQKQKPDSLLLITNVEKNNNVIDNKPKPEVAKNLTPVPTTTSRKRNKKTINELTSNYSMNESLNSTNAPQAISLQIENSNRNLRLEETLNNLSSQYSDDTSNNKLNKPNRKRNSTKSESLDAGLNQEQLANIQPIQYVKQYYIIETDNIIEQSTTPQGHSFVDPNEKNLVQLTTQQTIQQRDMHQNNHQHNSNHSNSIQQFQMPSPMLANLLNTVNTNVEKNNMNERNDIFITSNTNNINNAGITNRHLSNNNFEYINNSSYLSAENEKQQQLLNDNFNLMKSEDYKNILQMRQNFANQASMQTQYIAEQKNKVSTNQTEVTINHSNTTHEQLPVIGKINTSQVPSLISLTVTPKRRRAAADPSKSRTKRAKQMVEFNFKVFFKFKAM